MEGEKDLEKLSPELQEKSLDQIDLSDFFAELEEYHAEFNLGALMGSRSINLIEKGRIEKLEEERNNALDRIKEKYRKDLSRIGLNLEFIDDKNSYQDAKNTGDLEYAEYDDETKYEIWRLTNKKVIIHLVGTKRFLNYLDSFEKNQSLSNKEQPDEKQLEKSQISEGQLKGLAVLLRFLINQIAIQHDPSNPNNKENISGLLIDLNQIVKKCEKLKIDKDKAEFSESTETLSEYSKFSGCLKEYLLAKNNHLLDEVGGNNFGPSQWHIDCSKKNYLKKWKKTLETIDQIKENPKARALLEKVIKNLKESLKYAKKDLERDLLPIDTRTINPANKIEEEIEEDKRDAIVTDKRIIIDKVYSKLKKIK